jgi:threonine/homoserine/homoserine lactone efflux protein
VSSLLLRGFALGFAVAASPGPIFFLCLRRSLVRGWPYGLISGFGVATADAFYASVAAFGIGAIASVAAGGQRWLALVGGAVLVLLGVRTVLDRPKDSGGPPGPPTSAGLAWAYLSTLGLTITNPATIISFAALVATLNIGISGGLVRPGLVVLGVGLGSVTWWCIVAALAAVLRSRVTPPVVRGISLFSGVAIAILGLAAIYSAMRPQ